MTEQQPVPAEYNLHFTLPNGEATQVLITADNVTETDRYLIFMLEGRIVIAPAHERVLDWGELELQPHVVPYTPRREVHLGRGDGGPFAP